MYMGPERRLNRLPGFDYRQPGPYAVTICTRQRAHLFGTVRDGVLHHDPAGRMVADTWYEVATRFPGTVLDACVLMPNHLHAILALPMPPHQRLDTTASLSDVIGWFKTMSTRRYVHGVRTGSWPPFDRQVWQSGFYDHIVRGDQEMDRQRRYIDANPSRWHDDPDR
jgi:REP element-mobilizing transposase RayT